MGRIFYCFLYFFVAFIIINLISYVNSSNSFVMDDYNFGLYFHKEQIFDSLLNYNKFPHGGGYFVYFFTKFFCFALPTLLKIHPQDFISNGQSYIYSFIIVSLITIISAVPFVQNKNKICHFFTFLFVSIYFFFSIYITKSFCLISQANVFYRYVFCLLFFFIFIYYLYQHVCKISLITKYKLPLILFSIIMVATNFEILIYMTFFFYLLMFVYNFFSSQKFYFDKIYYSIFFTFVLSAGLYLTSVPCRILSEERGLGNISLSITDLFHFLKSYFKTCIFNEILLLLPITILCIFSFLHLKKDNKIQQIIFPIFLFVSLLIVYFSLIFCGKTNYDQISFWLDRETLVFTYKMILLVISFIILSCTFSINNNNKIFATTSIIFVILSTILLISTDKYFYIGSLSAYKKYKIHNYIGDKMLRFYYLKNQKPIIPNIKYNYSPLPSLYNYAIDDEITMCTKSNPYITNYYSKVYNDEKSIDMGYCLSNDAIDLFYQNGGFFTKSELNNIKFSNLSKDEYILTTSEKINIEDITSADELKNITNISIF